MYILVCTTIVGRTCFFLHMMKKKKKMQWSITNEVHFEQTVNPAENT